MEKYKYSETFFSPQGEGNYTGHSTLWIRFFLCNLQCNGFGQDNPTDPDSWELPYEKLDLTDITRVEDLPVFDKGCGLLSGHLGPIVLCSPRAARLAGEHRPVR